MVTPGGNRLYVSDHETALEIFRRRKDFRRDIKTMSVLNIYGQNISTTDGHEWQKHRKATVVAFAGNNELVWKESLAQARSMLESWLGTSGPICTTSKDTKTLTLNVLTAALFHDVLGADKGYKTSDVDDTSAQYGDSLKTMMLNIIPILVLGARRLQYRWMPMSLKRAGCAVDEFRTYVLGLINEEKMDIKRGRKTRTNLVASLVRACNTEQSDMHYQLRNRLTENEVVSNVFVYAIAGKDTTSITLAHAIVYLAVHPTTQEWIRLELNHYMRNRDEIVAYEIYPKLRRCMAVMVCLSKSPVGPF